MNVLLSIKPKFAELIFKGEKKFEYRKCIFKNSNVRKIIVYASNPIKKIIGEIEIDEIIKDKPCAIWEKTKNFSGINKEFFFEYFYNKSFGFAIKIQNTILYNKPIDPRNYIEGFKPPQSFMYFGDNFLTDLMLSRKCN